MTVAVGGMQRWAATMVFHFQQSLVLDGLGNFPAWATFVRRIKHIKRKQASGKGRFLAYREAESPRQVPQGDNFLVSDVRSTPYSNRHAFETHYRLFS